MSHRICPFLLSCIVVVVVCASLRSPVVHGEQTAAASTTSPPDMSADFKDKIVLFEVNRSNALESKSGSVVLAHVRITKLGSRDFIVGDGYAEGSDDSWYKDMTVGVPCDAILRFHAMTPTQFNNYMKFWKERSSKDE